MTKFFLKMIRAAEKGGTQIVSGSGEVPALGRVHGLQAPGSPPGPEAQAAQAAASCRVSRKSRTPRTPRSKRAEAAIPLLGLAHRSCEQGHRGAQLWWL